MQDKYPQNKKDHPATGGLSHFWSEWLDRRVRTESLTIIFANGDAPPKGWDWARGLLAQDAILIGVDGGANHLGQIQRVPDVVVGDMDSIDDELHAFLASRNVKKVMASPRKDESDLELALVYAAENFTGTILILGASGGRLDQTLSNVILLSHPALLGKKVIIGEPEQRAWVISGRSTIFGKRGDIVSLLPLWGEVQVRRTEGLEWSLHQERLYPVNARGLSNRMTADQAIVEVAEGRVLCVHTDGKWDR